MAAASQVRFPAALRVKRGGDFDRAYALRQRRDFGVIVVYGAPNGLTIPRLGLSIGRRVGGAVQRNRLKRLLREAFRLSQAALPAGIDLVVVARPHEVRTLAEYAQRLREAGDAFRERRTADNDRAK